jgi:DNA-binding CsgD family transcriptional regulator
MNFLRNFFILLFLLLAEVNLASPSDNPLLQKGWAALVRDDENVAFNYFWQAFEKAQKGKNTEDKAEALLYLGICSYGSSSENGLRYVTQSLSEYKKLESTFPEIAKNGRSRCLQLISTIYSRQKKYAEAIRLSREVIANLEGSKDETGTLGLAYNSLGTLYEIQKKIDSSDYFFNKALIEFEKNKSNAYLSPIYIKKGNIEKRKGNKKVSFEFYQNASLIAEKSENKQAQVLSSIAKGNWFLDFENNYLEAERLFNQAKIISKSLSDKTFEIKSLEALIVLAKKQNDFKQISQLQSEILKIKDNYYSLEREQIAKNLEVQFEVSEKDRKLELISKEKEVSRLTNILLILLVVLLLVVFSFLYFFLKRINKRDKQLLKTKEELFSALEEQKRLKEIQFQNDLEHKESQLSAITLQMLQKNELLEEIKEITRKKEATSGEQLSRIVNSHFAQDSNWNDFDKYFESVNKNFYTKLKLNYPKISSNDLKICALIKLNLSIKEMASILNISPDSVKTARHRLRKKLDLSTEDNLTEFILSI